MKRRRTWIGLAVVATMLAAGAFSFWMYGPQANRHHRVENYPLPVSAPTAASPSKPSFNSDSPAVVAARPAISSLPASTPPSISRKPIPNPPNSLASSTLVANSRVATSNGFANAASFQQPAMRSRPTQRASQTPRISNGIRQAASGFQTPTQPLRSLNTTGTQNPFGSTRPSQPIPAQKSNPASTLGNRTTAAPNTLLGHVLKGIPDSAGNVQALIRASYSVPEEHTQALVKLFAVADVEIECSVVERVLTVTADEEAHKAISRYVATIVQDKSQPYLAPQDNRTTAVIVNGNQTYEVKQTSYETYFEPDNFGFASSAEQVRVLLRARYVLPEAKANALNDLLNCENKLVLETKCSTIEPPQASSKETAEDSAANEVGTEEPADSAEADESDESDESDEPDDDNESPSDVDDESVRGNNEDTHAEVEPKSSVCVTTTRLGQIAVGKLVSAVFETEAEAEKEKAKQKSLEGSFEPPKNLPVSPASGFPSPAQTQGFNQQPNFTAPQTPSRAPSLGRLPGSNQGQPVAPIQSQPSASGNFNF